MAKLKKPSRRTIIIIAVGIGLFAVSYVELTILSLPPWAPGLTYLALAAAALLANRYAVMAMLGNYYVMRGFEGRGVPLLTRALAKGVKSPVAHLNLAVTRLRAGQAAEALELCRKAEKLNMSVMSAKNLQVTIGSCYWVLGDIDKGIETMEAMRGRFDYVNANVLSTLAYLYILKQDYERARELSEAAIADTPSAHAAWDNLGQIAYYQGDDDAAEAAFAKALELKPNYVDSLYFSALARERKGDAAAARERFERAALADISPLNAVTKEQIEEKLKQYAGVSDDSSGD